MSNANGYVPQQTSAPVAGSIAPASGTGTVLVEASASWCGYCPKTAEDLVKMNPKGCTVRTVLEDEKKDLGDGTPQNPGAVGKWKKLVSAAAAANTATGTEADDLKAKIGNVSRYPSLYLVKNGKATLTDESAASQECGGTSGGGSNNGGDSSNNYAPNGGNNGAPSNGNDTYTPDDPSAQDSF
jgi:thiol-disulfide isomerase/thioredoxin